MTALCVWVCIVCVGVHCVCGVCIVCVGVHCVCGVCIVCVGVHCVCGCALCVWVCKLACWLVTTYCKLKRAHLIMLRKLNVQLILNVYGHMRFTSA